jgi:hydroxymethylbilane synthase
MTNRKILKPRSKIVIGTRGSALAQWQTNHVSAALRRRAPDLQIEMRIIKTTGDQDQTRSLAELGGLGVFTKEIENALLAREIDLAVHSLKDLPADVAAGLAIAAITEREDPRDCIVSRHGVGLQQLPRNPRIGTSSARRSAQVLALRPDAQIVPLRGNVDTRLRKAQSEEYDAIVIAAAGAIRLGRANEITEYLSFGAMLPDPGQGALVVEIRAGDAELAALVAPLDHAPTRAAVTAERAFLEALGGGCRMPIGTYGEVRGNELHLRAIIASDDGARITRGEIHGDPSHAAELGAQLAARLAGARYAPPLEGKRILITRAREQASTLVEKIRALGGEPIEFPTIAFAPPEDFGELDGALARVREFDWVVFTSVNGARAVVERLRALGKEPQVWASAALSEQSVGELKGAPKIAAIGPATARGLEELGLHVAFVPTKFLGEQIAVELPIERGQRALLLRADIASDVLARGLEARGVAVTNVDAYRTIMPPKNKIDLRQIDAVTFTSSSTVRNFVAMRNDIGNAAVFCIGPVTADTARELGLRVDAVADEHTIAGLVNTMVTYYQESTTTG